MKPKRRSPSLGTGLLGAKSIMYPTPLGTVGIIAPWNFPVGMVFYPAASILASGNKIMAKPSEITPNTANLIKEAVEKYFDPSENLHGGPLHSIILALTIFIILLIMNEIKKNHFSKKIINGLFIGIVAHIFFDILIL